MSSTISSVLYYIALVSIACSAAPLLNPAERDVRSVNKFTCKHKSEERNRNWKQCSNQGDDILNLSQMQIPQAVSMNHISALNIPIK